MGFKVSGLVSGTIPALSVYSDEAVHDLVGYGFDRVRVDGVARLDGGASVFADVKAGEMKSDTATHFEAWGGVSSG